MSVLKVDHITINFGGLIAVDDFSLEMNKGDLFAIIGPNGAGKTTVFNMLTGIYYPTQGEIYVDGERMTARKPYEFAKAGVSRTFQNIRLFSGSTVLDNVKMAHTMDCSYGYMDMVFRTGKYKKEEERITKESMELLDLFGLADKKDLFATQLPYGEQRKLEIARALATNPKLLLLDEPAAGMNPNETDELMQTVRSVRDQFGIAILLIEHDMNFVMGICEEITVLDYGRVIARGDGKAIRNNPKVIAAYLGGD